MVSKAVGKAYSYFPVAEGDGGFDKAQPPEYASLLNGVETSERNTKNFQWLYYIQHLFLFRKPI